MPLTSDHFAQPATGRSGCTFDWSWLYPDAAWARRVGYRRSGGEAIPENPSTGSAGWRSSAARSTSAVWRRHAPQPALTARASTETRSPSAAQLVAPARLARPARLSLQLVGISSMKLGVFTDPWPRASYLAARPATFFTSASVETSCCGRPILIRAHPAFQRRLLAGDGDRERSAAELPPDRAPHARVRFSPPASGAGAARPSVTGAAGGRSRSPSGSCPPRRRACRAGSASRGRSARRGRPGSAATPGGR